MEILIIGGTGVLSCAIAAECVSAGHRVTIVTDGSGKLPEPEGIERHLIIDRNDGAAMKSALATVPTKKWDLVVDSICYNDPQASSLFAAIGGKSRHTVVISTAILYDRRNAFPLKADSPTASPAELGEYGVGKIKMERFWLKAAGQHRHPATILRLPHILGVGCDLGLVPLHNRDPLLIERLVRKCPLLLADGGRQLLQVVFNRDVAKIILAAQGNPSTFGKVYNCANPEIITPLQYFEAITSTLGLKLDVINIPSEVIWESNWGWSPTTVSRILDMHAMESEIGIVPNTSYKEAIEISLSYLLSRPCNKLDGNAGCLQAVEENLKQHYEEIKLLLSACSGKREKTAVDKRMNDKAPRFS